MRAVLAGADQQDHDDVRGIAQMMRAGLYRPVHVKTLRSQKLRMLLTDRKLLQSKAIAIDNDLRGTLRNFGLKVGMVGKVKFEASGSLSDPPIRERFNALVGVLLQFATATAACSPSWWGYNDEQYQGGR